MDTAIQLHRVSRKYKLGQTAVPALREVSATFGRGEFTAVAGPSGSGKTTLLNLIGCLDKPDDGRVIIDGRDVSAQPLHKLAGLRQKFFGYVFQTFNLIPVLSAYENVEFPLLLDGRTGTAERKARVEALLERVGLAGHRRHRPNQLSGGQRQRVALARALVGKPLAVLADEPTANLDSTTGAEIIALMADLNVSEKVTFVLATHDSQIIGKAGRVLWMADGAIQQDRPTIELAQVS
jgi:putative ABC transport system ATP-binding protein